MAGVFFRVLSNFQEQLFVEQPWATAFEILLIRKFKKKKKMVS